MVSICLRFTASLTSTRATPCQTRILMRKKKTERMAALGPRSLSRSLSGSYEANVSVTLDHSGASLINKECVNDCVCV